MAWSASIGETEKMAAFAMSSRSRPSAHEEVPGPTEHLHGRGHARSGGGRVGAEVLDRGHTAELALWGLFFFQGSSR